MAHLLCAVAMIISVRLNYSYHEKYMGTNNKSKQTTSEVWFFNVYSYHLQQHPTNSLKFCTSGVYCSTSFHCEKYLALFYRPSERFFKKISLEMTFLLGWRVESWVPSIGRRWCRFWSHIWFKYMVTGKSRPHSLLCLPLQLCTTSIPNYGLYKKCQMCCRQLPT